MKCENCGHENLDDARFCASCGVLLAKDTGGAWIGRLVGGRFRVTRLLGEGGMGVVYAAEQQMGSTVRKAAIKTLHHHLSKDPSIVARFHREVGTVAQLEHPNTIKVFDFGSETDGTLYIAMEFVEGRSLDKVIEAEGSLTPARTVDILKQIAGALHEAHEQGIVHRDLKPENIVLGEKLGRKDFVKVLDFGIAQRSESTDAQREQKLTQQGMVLGTPPYMSPEQFTGVELDRRSDIYSLGVMTYEMLTGTLPFDATTPWQWATEHMTAQPYPIEQRPTGYGVPKSMRDAVMRALAKSPSERPATTLAFVDELEKALSGVSVTEPTQAMQAVPLAAGPVPSSIDPTASTGALPIAARAQPSGVSAAVTSTLRSEGPPGTEAGLSASSRPASGPVAKKSNAGVLALLGVALASVGGGAWVVSSGLLGGATETGASGGTTSTTAAGPPSPATSQPTTSPAAPATPETPANTLPSTPTTPPVSPPLGAGSGGSATGTSSPSGTGAATGGTSAGSSAGSTKAPPPPPKAVPCSECLSLVAGGSWSRATQAYSSCDAGAQKQCSAGARRAAAEQAKTALDAGKCSQLQSILRGAEALNAATAQVRSAAAKCK